MSKNNSTLVRTIFSVSLMNHSLLIYFSLNAFCLLNLSQLLGVELLSVLHRLLLTWDPPSVQLLITGVVQQIVRAAQDYLQEKRNTLSKTLNITNVKPFALTEENSELGDELKFMKVWL